MSYRLQPRIALAALFCAVLSISLLSSINSGPLAEPAAAAIAAHCNEDNGGCVPDGSPQTWCEASGFSAFAGLSSARSYSLDNMVTQTIYERQIADLNGECIAATDTIWVADQNLPAGTRGTYQCLGFNYGGYCSSSVISLNPDELTDTLNRRKTACHELGHSLGLEHHTTYSDCMQNGAVTSGHQTYDAYHVNNINKRTGDVGH